MRRPKHGQSTPEDHDSPWKGALEVFFQPFMDFLYPHISELIVQNRRQSVVGWWLDKGKYFGLFNQHTLQSSSRHAAGKESLRRAKVIA